MALKSGEPTFDESRMKYLSANAFRIRWVNRACELTVATFSGNVRATIAQNRARKSIYREWRVRHVHRNSGVRFNYWL